MGLRPAPVVTDPSNQILGANLSHLPLAVQRALHAATAQPSISLQIADSRLQASVRTDDGRWVPVHPSEDPVAASDRVAARFSDTQPPLIIVIGLGLGYLLDALERQGSTTRVLAIEPIPAITRAMLARRDWTNWIESGRLTILAGPDYTGSAEVWGLFGPGTPTPPTIMAPLLEREFGDAATRAIALARQIISGAKANEEARRQFAGRYLLNTLTNLPTIATEGDVSALFGAFARVPAVVVGAGPSLDKNLEDLAKLKGRILIIAVDTAVRPLLAAGIRPHLVVAVDPSDLNALHLRDLPDCRGLWFVAEGSVDSSVFPQFTGRTFTFKVSNHHPWPWVAEQCAGRGGLRAWGSVLTTAFDLACHVGCDPIIFAGADLAYTDGLQYCRNTVYEDKWRDFPTDAQRAEVFKTYLADRPNFPHPDVRGGEALTTPHFIQFRDWIVSRAGEAADRRIVNATGGGILHGGRIAQTNFSVLHLPKSKHDLGLERRLAAAWGAGTEVRRASLAALPESLTHRDALPIATWLEFAGATATAAQLETALDSAEKALTLAAATTAYLAKGCAAGDAQPPEADQARTGGADDHGAQDGRSPHSESHNEFHNGTRGGIAEGADAPQAQVLLDLLDRSRAQPADAHTRDAGRPSAQPLTGLRLLDGSCGVGLERLQHPHERHRHGSRADAPGRTSRTHGTQTAGRTHGGLFRNDTSMSGHMERAVIFGSGERGRQAYSPISQQAAVLAFVDNDPDQQHTTLLGHPVYSPSTLPEPPWYRHQVWDDPIAQDLMKYNFWHHYS